MDLEIKKISSEHIKEFQELINVFEEVFEMKNFKQPEEEYLQRLLQNETFFAVVAKKNNQVIGGLTVYMLPQYYAHQPLAYLYDLAVLKAYQRQGIGKNLIHFTKVYCKEQGFEELFVQADRVEDGAVDFYRHTGPTKEEDVIHFYYRLK